MIVEDYERKRSPIEPPDAIDAIRYRMEMGGFTQADLGRLLGSRQRATIFDYILKFTDVAGPRVSLEQPQDFGSEVLHR